LLPLSVAASLLAAEVEPQCKCGQQAGLKESGSKLPHSKAAAVESWSII
jgi:hypothetical protein